MNGSQQQQQKQSQSQSQPPNQKKAPEQEKLRRNSDISLSKSDYTSTTSTSTSSITSESPDSLAYQNQPTPPTINPTATTSATGEITNSNTGNKRTEDLRHVYANPATTILTTTVEGATRTGDKNNNTNNKPKQPILLRPKVQVLSIQAKAVVNEHHSRPAKAVVNEHHSRPANPAVLTAIAPIPRVVRPAPLKNNGITIFHRS